MINYYYDNGEVVGMKYDGTYYYFIKDLFGNIHQIKDSSHNLVAEYEYDAWGNNVITVNVNNIANVNPFRYRGYYMDTETGFYYLQTRYYDPVIRRFISPDNYELLPTLAKTGELNLYTYCNNSPVMYTDPTGESLFGFFAALVLMGLFTLVGGAVGAYVAYEQGLTGWEKTQKILFGMELGLIISGTAIALGSGIGKMLGYTYFLAEGYTLYQSFCLGLAGEAIGAALFGPITGEDFPIIEAGESPEPPIVNPTPPIFSVRRTLINRSFNLDALRRSMYD